MPLSNAETELDDARTRLVGLREAGMLIPGPIADAVNRAVAEIDVARAEIADALRPASLRAGPDPGPGPEGGHRFYLTATSQGSYRVGGGPHTDEPDDGAWRSDTPMRLVVRAWNLRDALLFAARRPLVDWLRTDDDLHPPETATELGRLADLIEEVAAAHRPIPTPSEVSESAARAASMWQRADPEFRAALARHVGGLTHALDNVVIAVDRHPQETQP